MFFISNFTLSLDLRATYPLQLTKESPIYSRECSRENYRYETIEINVQQDGSYTFNSNASILLYGYIYINDFDPSYPDKNLLTQSGFDCDKFYFQLGSYLKINTIYILVITTFNPQEIGSFTLNVTGPNNVTLNQISKSVFFSI